MASSSTSATESTSIHGWTYDVFLSFAGKDTRNGFVGHLYTALENKGIYTFRDDLQLRMGDTISEKLLKCIEESRLAIVIFSEKYAASSWCLDELVKIMECHKHNGQKVIPVFYDVDPSIVRRPKKDFETAFCEHEAPNKNDSEKVLCCWREAFRKHEDRYKNDLVIRWREALFEAANIAGCEISVTANGNESESIKKIVQEVSKNCRRNSSAANNLVGIVPRVQKVRSLLDTTSNDVRIIGIWGMGGAGKTTLAWAVYKEILNQFDGGSFVANVREVSKSSGLHFLQEQVLSELLSERDMKVRSDLEGTELMAIRLRHKKVLLVLDDVDDDGQLKALARSKDWFGMGSRIIITTRDKHYLEIAKVDEIYDSYLLENSEATQLLSINAFERSSPPKEFEEYSDQVVAYAAGLPLALEVLGSFLCNRTIREWESTLETLKVAPKNKINRILKLSFDGLEETEKRIFLDIACFFKGWERDYVTRILDSFDLGGHIGVSVLIEKSLLSVSKGRLGMHDLVQEMGQDIVRKVSSKPGEHSRLWRTEDVRHVLTRKTGTDAVQGICFNLNFDDKEDVNISLDTFEHMKELRIIHLHAARRFHMSQNKQVYTLSKLQWLTWENYISDNSDTLSEIFLGERLVGLVLHYSRIRNLWNGRKIMNKLRFIDLSKSSLQSTPDFERTPNLTSIILNYCCELVKVHPSIGALKQLVFLSLRGCTSLVSLPRLTQMESLQTLILTDCKRLKFLDFSGNMETLMKLYLDRTSIEVLPSSVGNLTGLVLLNLRGCHSLTSLPETVCRLKCLQTLILTSCWSLESLPKNIGELQSLEELVLDKTPIKEPPLSIVNLKNLKTLSMNRCMEMMCSLLKRSSYSLPLDSELPLLLHFGFIKRLVANNCLQSESVFPDDLSSLLSLEELDLGFNPFKYLPNSISHLPRLRVLYVSCCKKLKALQALPPTLAILQASHCKRLKSSLDFTKHESLWKLNVAGSYEFWGHSHDLLMQTLYIYLLQGHLIANHRLSIFLPGNKIPEWFTQQNKGQDLHLQLPSNWCNGDILGFAICVGFAFHEMFSGHINIWFELIEEKMEGIKLLPTEMPSDPIDGLWLGFISLDFFQLLFPQLKPDDWSMFEGNLRMQLFSGVGSIFYGKNEECAIRLVYKKDMEGMTTFRNLGGVLNDPTGRPWLVEYPEDEDRFLYDSVSEYKRSINRDWLSTTYYNRKGRLSAEIRFQV